MLRLKKTCLLSVASSFLSPTADSTTTCVMYSFKVSERYNQEMINPHLKTRTTVGDLLKPRIPGATASPSTDEQLLHEMSVTRRQGFWSYHNTKQKVSHHNIELLLKCNNSQLLERGWETERVSEQQILIWFARSFHQSVFLCSLIFSHSESASCAQNNKTEGRSIPLYIAPEVVRWIIIQSVTTINIISVFFI